jgi:predicted RNA binding protein YcfA (HicA-like mRNA interferase family)
MAQLPALRSTQVVRALLRAGFVRDRQRGSHLVLFHPDRRARTVVPIHARKTINKPLLRAIIHDAGMPVEEFLELV